MAHTERTIPVYLSEDKCRCCGSEKIIVTCTVCHGTGVHWGGVCPLCDGEKKNTVCPVARYLSLGESFAGVTCKTKLEKEGKGD
jgi:hypothetical protein